MISNTLLHGAILQHVDRAIEVRHIVVIRNTPEELGTEIEEAKAKGWSVLSTFEHPITTLDIQLATYREADCTFDHEEPSSLRLRNLHDYVEIEVPCSEPEFSTASMLIETRDSGTAVFFYARDADSPRVCVKFSKDGTEITVDGE